MNARLLIVLALSMLLTAPALAQQIAAEQGRGDVFNEAVYSNRTIAEQWGLSEEEIERYRMLMIVEMHYGSSQISPLEVLGKHARNYAEADKYAQMAAEKYNEQVKKSLEWAVLFSNRQESGNKTAYEIVSESDLIREYLEGGGVDTSVFAKRWQDEMHGTNTSSGQVQSTIKSTTRVRYFIDLKECRSECEGIWDKIRNRLEKGGAYAGIDVVFVENNGVKPTREAVSSWATSKGIKPREVDSKTVTLNWINDRYREILGSNELPVAIDSSGALVKP